VTIVQVDIVANFKELLHKVLW